MTALLRTTLTTLFISVMLASPSFAKLPPIDVTITSDNAYAFGFGNYSGMTDYIAEVANCSAGDIFNCTGGPETYTITSVPLNGYIYIVAWSDEGVYQGTIAEFTDGTTTVLTGPTQPWEVYATNIDYDPACPIPNGPTMADINTQIAIANSASGAPGTSLTWVNDLPGPGDGNLAYGEPNDTAPTSVPSAPFPQVCGINPAAQWMWYNPDPSLILYPFVTGSIPRLPATMSREYLIFRVGPLEDLLMPCATISNETLFCDPTTGLVSYNFDLTNNSGQDVSHVLIPSATSGTATVTPNVHTFSPPIPDGGTENITLYFSGGLPGEEICINLGLSGQDFEECCGLEHCVTLPDCECGQVVQSSVTCNSDGTYQFDFVVQHLASWDAEWCFLIPPAGVSFSPDNFALAPVSTGGTVSLSSTISGVSPGDNVCFQISLHDVTLDECCDIYTCVDIPDCDGGCVTDFTCVANGDVITFTWTPPLDPDCCVALGLSDSTGTTIVDLDPSAGTYTMVGIVDTTFCIRCIDADGNPSSALCCDLEFLASSGGTEFMRGDANGDGVFDISDATRTLSVLFGDGTTTCLAAIDVNGDAIADLSDAVGMLTLLFSGNEPGLTAGDGCEFADESGLSCVDYAHCP